MTYDVIVSGARVAGSSTASLLDRARFPSDTCRPTSCSCQGWQHFTAWAYSMT